MARYSVAALIGCLYIAGAIWLVRSQGEAYRTTLHQTRLAAQPPPPITEPPAQKAAAERAVEQPSPVVVAAHDPPAATPPSQLLTPAPESKPASPSIAELPRPKDTPPPAKPRPEPDDYWKSPDLAAVWDVSHCTTDDEIRLGQKLHELVLRFNPPLQEKSYRKRVMETAEPLLECRSRKDINYKFTVLDSDAVCAFSHPGGYIYVCRGLFDMIGEDEDYALRFVLAHEIAHVDLKHALRCLADPGFKDSGMGTLAAYYLVVAPMAYQETQEYEADAWALRKMQQKPLDHSRYEVLAFLRRFKTYAEENEFEDGHKPPQPPKAAPVNARDAEGEPPQRSGRAVDLIENHFRAHPAAWERLKKLEALWPAGKG